MSEDIVDLSSLKSYVNLTLATTIKVQKIIQIECEEANFILRPWIEKSVITGNNDKNYCICASKLNEDKLTAKLDIGMGKALAQVQQLRKKVTRDINKDNRQTQRDVGKNYISASTSERHLSNSKQKKQICISSGNLSVTATKSKLNKNFIVENKSRVRAICQKNTQIIKKQKFGENKREMLMKKNGFSSISELNSLIETLSLDMMRENLSSPAAISELSKNNCHYCHSNDLKKIVTVRNQTIINLVDDLEQLRVPDNLLSILRIYHLYITNYRSDNTDARFRPSIKKFLNKFQKINENHLKSVELNDTIRLIIEFPKLYRDLHTKNFNSTAISKIKTNYNKLDILSKQCGIIKYESLKTKRSGINLDWNNVWISRGWLSNGIWNLTSLHHFSYFIKAPCIQYTHKNQLLSIFDATQRLQYTIHRNNLLDLLLHNIVPIVKRNKLNLTTKEYVEIYRMIFMIAQILNPKFPVLVKMDE